VEAEWLALKLEAWRRMNEDLHIGYLDEDILDVLLEIFMRPKSFPKSSCSGRITIIDSEYPWLKEDTMTIYKTHYRAEPREIINAMSKPHAHNLWLSVQGPIYHIYVMDLEEAEVILAAAREAGFKHSGVLRLRKPILVELRTGIRGDILLAARSKQLIDTDEAVIVVEVANEILAKAKERNRRLLQALRSRRPRKLWEPALQRARELGLL